MKMSGLFACLTFAVALTATSARAQIKHGLRDADGRHLVPRGFVVVTNAGRETVTFTADDYARMVRMGANFQVVRLELGKLSAFPGARLDENYLATLDTLVRLGRDAGIVTVFKMTTYGVESFTWEKFWQNGNREHEIYTDAWKVIWKRFRDDTWVWGYDLINEPRKLTLELSYDELTSNHLIPLYRRLIDESNRVSAAKFCLCQAIFMNKGDGIDHNQYAEIKTPIGRKNIFFSPHIYLENANWLEPVLQRLERESALLEAPLFIGEWGFPTFQTTDASVPDQLKYTNLYIRTTAAFDRLGVGTIKAWFSGNPTMQNFLKGGPSTWAIFSDRHAVGTVERKYITDVIARPYPQVIAGDIQSFRFDAATRTLDVAIRTDNRKGASRIFVGADRHFPDGFLLFCGDELVLRHHPLRAAGLEVLQSARHSNPADFIWDESRQQLIVLRWPVDHAELQLKVRPGLNPDNSLGAPTP